MHTSPNLSEQEILNDALASEKQLISIYGTYIAEASCQNLRGELQKILDETQQTQFEIFKAIETKGWYNVQNADLQQVQQAVQKYQQIKTQLK